jgi:NADPH-dependent methylglyoxal reductase
VTFEEAAVADGVTAYCASKTLAERAMWDWVGKNKPKFDLVTITPPWVFGPYATELTSTKHLSESVALLYGILDSNEIPPFDFGGYVDARDLAAAHVLAHGVPAAGGQRFWVGQNFGYQAAVDVARAESPELKKRLPAGEPGHVEDTYKVDGSKATKVLGFKYLPFANTVKDTYSQLLHAEQVEAGA